MWLTLLRGRPGHPAHPPFTDAVIGMFTLAAGLSVIGYAGAIKDAAGKSAWLALIGGLIAALPAATTGFADWVTLTWGTERWRAATWHLAVMVTAVTVFAFAAWLQYDGYKHGHVTTGGLVLTLVGFLVLLGGGWLGGSIVFVHGMRVLGRSDEGGERRGEDGFPSGPAAPVTSRARLENEQGGDR